MLFHGIFTFGVVSNSVIVVVMTSEKSWYISTTLIFLVTTNMPVASKFERSLAIALSNYNVIMAGVERLTFKVFHIDVV